MHNVYLLIFINQKRILHDIIEVHFIRFLGILEILKILLG